MAISIGSRLKQAWNAFLNRSPTNDWNYGRGDTYRPDRPRLSRGNEKTIITSVYNRIAVDAASIAISHVNIDENGRYTSNVSSGLQECLTLSANIDQTGRALIQDAVMSMLDEGCIAIVPVDMVYGGQNGTDIYSLRVGKIITWYPTMVKVQLYNEQTGVKEEITIPKETTAIVENPFYAIMNEPNSTLQRLIRKLSLLDSIDEQSGAGKMDLIIQLPYVIKSEARKAQAESRRKDIEEQLRGSKYGIAYTDGTERITQLNRPIENNLMKQIEYLTNTLYGQLGITQAIMDGSADEKSMINYMNRTVEPIMVAIADEMKRKFISKTSLKKGQTIMLFADPFKLVTVNELSEMADKFTRNEIMSSNEIRQIMGIKPSDDPKADELNNANISRKSQG